METDCQAVECSDIQVRFMQNGFKSEGWVLTNRAGWRHNKGGVDTKKIKQDKDTQTFKTNDNKKRGTERKSKTKINQNLE